MFMPLHATPNAAAIRFRNLQCNQNQLIEANVKLLTNREPISHYNSVNTQGIWRQGFVGQLSRLRGAASIILSDFVIGGGVLAWASASADITPISVSPLALAAGVLGIALVTSMAIWWTIRRYRVRFLVEQERLHLFTHLVRDKIVKAGKTVWTRGGTVSPVARRELLEASVAAMAEAARGVLQIAVGDVSIKCSIRLAEMSKDQGTANDVVYTIAGRSGGFDPNRTSITSIPADKGVPGYFLRQQKRQGVLVYRDLRRAEELGALQRTENDMRFPDDYSTFMVAPINGREIPDRDAMVGLLYVFSKSDPFGAHHVDVVRAIADVLGTALPQLVELLVGREGDANRGEA